MEIYMIGIKGAGMSALANILLDDQYLVRGSDKKDYIHSQDELIKRKVIIDSLQQEEYLNSDIIIIGHSFYTDELVQKLNRNKKVYFEYHEFLSLYLDQSKTISICGSHGKTTLTKLLAKGSLNASYLIGDGEGSKKESDDFFFLESCEYKNHFLLYNHKEIIITNIDYDHVDFFKDENDYVNSFKQFANKGEKVYCLYQSSLFLDRKDNLITYGLTPKADYFLQEKKDIYVAYHKNKELINFHMERKPNHFLEKIIALIAFYNEHNYDLNIVLNKIQDFEFPYQRFNVEEYNGSFIISDYCHHPSQIEFNYEQLCFYYENYIKIAIFRPDRASRIVAFKERFIEELKKYDYAFVLPLSKTENSSLSSKELEEKHVKVIDNVDEILEIISPNKQYCFSFMSSKNLTDDISFFKELLLKLKL